MHRNTNQLQAGWLWLISIFKNPIVNTILILLFLKSNYYCSSEVASEEDGLVEGEIDGIGDGVSVSSIR